MNIWCLKSHPIRHLYTPPLNPTKFKYPPIPSILLPHHLINLIIKLSNGDFIQCFILDTTNFFTNLTKDVTASLFGDRKTVAGFWEERCCVIWVPFQTSFD